MRIKLLFLFCFLNVLVLFSAWGGVPPITAKIVFSGNREKFEQRDIYLMNPDGKEVVNLTNHSADDLLPTFSPTGEQILFCSDRNGAPFSFDLYLMNADGSDTRRVFDKSALRITPTWSPDGKQIAYVRSETAVANHDMGRSEESKVGVKGPLTLGVATSGALLAQAIMMPDAAAFPCNKGQPCPPGYHCHVVGSCVKH